MRPYLRALLLPLTAAACTSAALAQDCQPGWTRDFSSGYLDAAVLCSMVFDEDGSGPQPPALFIGGTFEIAGGFPCPGLARWDGVQFTQVGGGLGGQVAVVGSMTVFDDGSGPALYVGGGFSSAGGIPTLNLAKWDGQHWTPLPVPAGSGGPAAMIGFDPDDDGPLPRQLIAARVDVGQAQNQRGLARWNGSSWETLPNWAGGTPKALAIFDEDGPGANPSRLIVSGGIVDPAGGPAWQIARFNGQNWSTLGPVDHMIDSMCVFDPDGPGVLGTSLYVGGRFDTVNFTPMRHVARWNGQQWSALGAGVEGDVLALTTYDRDGSGPGVPALIAAGNVDAGTNTVLQNVMQWTGSTWQLLGSGVTSSNYPGVATLCSFQPADGVSPPVLYAGGGLKSAGPFAAACFASWNGQAWRMPGEAPFVAALVPTVPPLAEFDPDGPGPGPSLLYVGGNFTQVGAQLARGLAAWNGAAWQPVAGFNDTVRSLFVLDADDTGPQPPALYCGGVFTTAGGVAANRIARFDGASWNTFGTGFGNNVRAMEYFDADGAGPNPPMLYAGGDFVTTGSGAEMKYLARWTGQAWESFSGIDGPVYSLKSFDPDGAGPAPAELFVGGLFGHVTGVTCRNIVRYNGQTWSGFGSGTDTPGGQAVCRALVIQDADGDGPALPALYLGGNFQSIDGAPIYGVARLSGSSWTALSSQVYGAVHGLRSYDPDGGGPMLPRLLAVGTFTNLVGGGPSVRRVAEWNGANWSELTGGTDPWPYSVTVYPSHGPGIASIYVAGTFTEAAGGSSWSIARWNTCRPACYANCDASVLAPSLNVADFVCFLNRFAAADPYANCDGSSLPPTLNVADFICFLNNYAVGCP